jgi:hypothetical protein
MARPLIRTETPLYVGETFRIHPISRLVFSRMLDEEGLPRFDEDAFEELPLSEGVGIEAKCGVDEAGHDYYYVVAFVKWDSRLREPTYEAMLTRIADVWKKNPAAGEEFSSVVEKAIDIVREANGR